MYSATGLCLARKLSLLQAAGFETITEAQLSLFHHIDPKGTRLTTLAARATLTKSSMIELADKAEHQGLVCRTPDPEDGRAKLITPTEAGLRFMGVLRVAIDQTEQWMVSTTSPAFIADLKQNLGHYIPATADHDPYRTDLAATGHSAARALSLSARRFAADALSVVHEHGYNPVTASDLALLRNLDLTGSRLTDLALRARMTKQSMRELVDRAEAQGLVDRAVDPHDARAKLIAFTSEGLRFLDQMRRGLAIAEDKLRAATDAAFVETLKAGLTRFILEGH